MTTSNSSKEVQMEQDMFAPSVKKRNPLVLVGAIGTAGVLVMGLAAFRNGNQNMSQSMMRTRVVFQGVTVALMVATSGAAGISMPDPSVLLPQSVLAAFASKSESSTK
mmetsp:Transcript_17294/g.33042  ORF Transcript_17294/g.33042 Transcript_17294/m.33042 type:complete len:108 (-) Transcript_17294:205-528(-)|eukprot:CAMPEP_0114247730 /NCGR_PEP_ID=MMETSP0058-20121206/13181_1 /TAXON_ID=36894 /ORGANISM="Pyramimonas parkeae, CCMP726" /LENGTH=107 /DNA_ID=CAMNT_0001361061 /DNA_START=211 /DNA_END=534 /DNA_ORIENTATION=-